MPSCGRSLATWEPFSQSFLLGFDIASLLLILEVFYFQVLELFADLLSIFPSTGSRFLAILTCLFSQMVYNESHFFGGAAQQFEIDNQKQCCAAQQFEVDVGE